MVFLSNDVALHDIGYYFPVPPPVMKNAVLESTSESSATPGDFVARYRCMDGTDLLVGNGELFLGEGDSSWAGSFTCGGTSH